ncbi:MAG TPA: RtcB family protein [Pyrinomonadaceae bacterium]
MTKPGIDLRLDKSLADAHRWKHLARWNGDGYYALRTEDTSDVPVRLFLTPNLLESAEDTLYRQIVNATRFPGVKMVVITPDVHYGYGVPVGCVLITDYESGAIAMGPVGYDIGCGMMSAKSDVEVDAATPEKRLQFNQAVMDRIEMGAGGKSHRFRNLAESEFTELVHGGAEYYVNKYGATFDRSRAERHRIPVDDDWEPPFGGKGKPERGRHQLGSLGGGNHFIELQREVHSDKLFVQVHTGSRGFGHGLATNYFELARQERREVKDIDLGYFTPDSKHYRDYLNAVAAGGNYAILNRLIIFEQVAEAFRETFNSDLKLIYEISHNLVQKEWHPEFGDVWVHRKGATRAFPAGYPLLKGTLWEDTGHPVLIPGSNKDFSYILRPLPDAVKSGYSVNHGAGRRMSRSQATKTLSQRKIDDEYAEAGILVNVDGHVPIDESSACYKSSEEVVKAVLDAGLAEIQHKLWPLSSLKGIEEGPRWRKRKRRKPARASSEHF